MKRRNIDFTEGKLLPLIIAYWIPLVFAGLVQTMFSAADMAVLGAFDKSADSSAVGAIGATGAIISLIVNSVIGFSGGTNVLLARAVGAKDEERSQRIVGSSLTLAAVMGFLVITVGMLVAPWFLKVTDCPANSYDGALTYLYIYIAAAPAIFIYNFGSAIIRVSGDSRSPFIYILISGAVNVVLNFILCVILEEKVAAVGIATLVANMVGALLTVLHLLRLKDGPCRVDIQNLQVSANEIRNIVLLGLPNAFTTAIYSISNLQIQSAINSFGSSASAGNNASAQVETFVSTLVTAVSTTAMVAVGQNIGAQKKDRIKHSIILCIIMNTAVSLVLGYTALAFGKPLLRIFVPNDALAVDIGKVRLMCLLTIYFIMAIDNTLSSSIRAFGNTLLPMLNSLVTVVLFRTIWMNFIYPNMTFVGDPVKDIFNVYECYIISWIMSFVVQIVLFFAVYNRYIKKHKEDVKNMVGNLFILGDSYSTFKGHIPREDAFYYRAEQTDPPSVMTMKLEETWWYRLVTETGATIVRNDSWSGATISYTGYLGDCSATSSFIYRYRTLRDEGFFSENRVDTLIVFGGTNDSWVPSPLGEDREYTSEEDLYFALPAIKCLMSEMKRDLPKTRLVYILNTEINEKIIATFKEEGERLGIETVQLENIDKIDGHPTPLGMSQITDQILKAL